jgi:hypothetical protein
VIDLIRNLLDRPLDPRLARAVVVLSITITFAFAILVTFGVIAGSVPGEVEDRGGEIARTPSAPPAQQAEPPAGRSGRADSGGPPVRPRPEQDPQDRPGGKDYRRAREAMREHRALQHLPYEHRGVAIVLAGADRGRAVVHITAGSVARAKHQWRAFLAGYRDDGRAYEPRFAARPKVGRGVPARSPKSTAEGGSSGRSRSGSGSAR